MTRGGVPGGPPELVGVGSAADEGGGKGSDALIAEYKLHMESHPPWGDRVGGGEWGGGGGSRSLINTSIFTINALNIHEQRYLLYLNVALTTAPRIQSRFL